MEEIKTEASAENTNNTTDTSAEEEVTFAYSEKSKGKDKTAAASGTEAADGSTPGESGEDDVVFAAMPESGKSGSVTRHQMTYVRQKKKFPKVPVVIGSVALLCLAAVGIVFAMLYDRNGSPTVAGPSAVSQVSQTSGEKTTQPSEPSVLPVIRIADEAEIKTINTATIVFGDNVTVSGVDLHGKTLSEAYDAMQKRMLELRERINITVSCDGKLVTLTQDDFLFDTDLPEVLIQAYHYSRGELDSPTVTVNFNNGIADFAVNSVVNVSDVKTAVKKVSDTFDIQPVDATVTKFDPTKTEKFTYADGKVGYLIDQKDVTSRIGEILLRPQKTGAFSIETVKTPFNVTLADIKANTKLISSNRTTARNVWASNQNMKLAIRTASGTIVKPGEVFSFNTMTGDTTNGALGYVPSTAIVRGQYEQQYGGGICQASTTIYICALKAGMEVLERHAHQYASNYADPGLDATVDYGNLDMRFKNNTEFPLYIASYVYDYDGDGFEELMVEMYGQLPTEFDEVVPVGWVTYTGSESYSASAAQVFFKNGKEVKRVQLPAGTYDYHGEGSYYLSSMTPANVDFGPTDVTPTKQIPTVYSPGGCGSNAPIPYGTAEEYLKKANATG